MSEKTLVERLRLIAQVRPSFRPWDWTFTVEQAADRIEELEQARAHERRAAELLRAMVTLKTFPRMNGDHQTQAVFSSPPQDEIIEWLRADAERNGGRG